MLVSRLPKESKSKNTFYFIRVHRTPNCHFCLTWAALSDLTPPPLRWPIESGDLCKSWLTAVFNPEYEILPTRQDVELCQLIFLLFASFFFLFFLIYLFTPWYHFLIILHAGQIDLFEIMNHLNDCDVSCIIFYRKTCVLLKAVKM